MMKLMILIFKIYSTQLLFQIARRGKEKVCFAQISGCDKIVNLLTNRTSDKDGNIYFYGDALMYASIFSDKEIYNCQLRRLMKRISELAKIYDEKENFVSQKNCYSNVYFDNLISFSNNFNESSQLQGIIGDITDMDKRNRYAGCKLW